MSRTPEFDELLGGAEVGGNERERLRRTHDLLAQAGPPAELPPWLEQPPAPWLDLAERRRARAEHSHRRLNRFLLPSAAAAAAFVIGLTLGGGHSNASKFKSAFRVQMHGTTVAKGADAVIDVGYRDSDGNVPMILKVAGLKELPVNGYYELFLTRNGKIAGTCGTFTVARPVTTVQLNVPYELRRGDGWIVLEHVGRSPRQPKVLTT